jgi:hypothetical protein
VSEQNAQPEVAPESQDRLQQIEQQLTDLQKRLGERDEQIAAAEAQRDEAQSQVTIAENRLAAERLLAGSGVVDVETASLVLSKRVDLAEDLDEEALSRSVEQLLLDKPFLRAPQAPLPGKTASPRGSGEGVSAKLARTAERAARTGDRRDVAEYLRLRRQIASNPRKR